MSDPTKRIRNSKHTAFKWVRRKRPVGPTGPAPLDRPCPDCRAETRAYVSQKKSREFCRVCKNGHRWAWTKRGIAIRRIELQKPNEPECIFPGCGRLSVYEVWKRQGRGKRKSGSRLCQGHEKQKERHGWDALRPLRSYAWAK